MLVRASGALRGLPRGLRLTGRRGLSGTEAAAACFPLNRALLRLQGREVEPFLQGLLTNDVSRLAAGGGASEAPRAQYAHLLNVQGRCLYDVILYRIHESSQEEAHILMECDAAALDSLQKHLKLYKIRRKVSISPCPDLSLWAVIPKEPSEVSRKLQCHAGKAVVVTSDPRTDIMGWRLITGEGTNPLEILPGSQIGNIKDYHRHRFKQGDAAYLSVTLIFNSAGEAFKMLSSIASLLILQTNRIRLDLIRNVALHPATGIPEGVKDLPTGIALPLESNLAYMNGVSFTKGCYIGQELTARTHHMGVIRKRLLPIQLAVPMPSESIPDGTEILTESGKSAGKYRAGIEELAIALLRLANANEPLHLKLSGGTTVNLTASIPEWWPKPTDA